MIEVTGVDQLVRLSRALKLAGEKELKREMTKGINQAMKPVMVAVRESARRTLPARGGLNKKVAKTRMRTIQRTGANTAAVRLRAQSSYHLGWLNRGILHHPVFGNRDEWVTQRVPAGWWDKPTQAAAPTVRREIQRALDDVARKIDRAV